MIKFRQRIPAQLGRMGRMAVMILCLLLSSCQEEQKPLSPFADRVLEYLPAPGQFINSEPLASAEEACAYAQRILDAGSPISLGGFGGYIVVGFDHSIEDNGGYCLAIRSNVHEMASEPGIVYVMRDANGNGRPDDVWYELKGSEYGQPGTLQDYSVTYFRPSGPGSDVAWQDNLGNSGTIDYMPAFHTQECYYPAWIAAESYTLSGACLAARNEDVNGDGSLWDNKPYDWGYVDNLSTVDMQDGYNCFRLSDAVDASGNAVHLGSIDFVKVQTAVNAKSGWTGELSTEVGRIADYNLIFE